MHAPGVGAALRVGGRRSPTLILIFVAMNALVLLNACLHDPGVGYDATSHLHYVAALASGHLVTPEQSSEYYSPPVPYAVPALVMRVSGVDVWWAAKMGQMLNVLLSIGTALFVLRICDLIEPGARALKPGALGFLAILPVYYKTFSFVRGEPYVTFFATAAAFYAIRTFVHQIGSRRDAIALGVALGCAELSRQWGILLVPSIIAMAALTGIRRPAARRQIAIALTVTVTIGFLLSSWFYFSLHRRYGSMTAYVRMPMPSFRLSNQPRSFYVGLGLPQLFEHPVRDAFPNQFLPIFYSELWGDYWGYFVVFGRDTRNAVGWPATRSRMRLRNPRHLIGSRPTEVRWRHTSDV
jgi:4-amino-4-deoxy-L-arabinose transferase-like glycosyltransferase